MSDLTSQILIYPFTPASMAWVGLLTIYPQAAGSYITYLGSGREQMRAGGVSAQRGILIVDFAQWRCRRIATPLKATSRNCSTSALWGYPLPARGLGRIRRNLPEAMRGEGM